METRKRRKKKRPLAALLFIGLLLGFVACTVKIPVPVTMEIDRKAETREEKVDAVYTYLHVPLYCQYPSLPTGCEATAAAMALQYWGEEVTPEEVAEAVEYVLTQREGIVIPELVLRPQFHRIRKKK